MKNYAIVFRDSRDHDRVVTFDNRVREQFGDVAYESDVGLWVVSTDLSAEEIIETVGFADATLADILIVLELGSSAAVGCAGIHFIRALAGILPDVSR